MFPDGPTNFAPIISEVTKMAMQNMDGSNYFVLLLLTNGNVTDLQRTIDAIVEASYTPMSIIIAGVGDNDWTIMNQLDGDDRIMRSSYGKQAQR
jgi:hypothetical protein